MYRMVSEDLGETKELTTVVKGGAAFIHNFDICSTLAAPERG